MGNGCPPKCCKKVAPVAIIANAETRVEIKSGETPHGCCILYPGVHTDNGQNTCPILAVHTWHMSRESLKTETGVMHTMGVHGGYPMGRGREATMITDAGERVQFKVGVDEEILILPIEDIISIKVSSEVKKAVEQKKTARRKNAPSEELGCCQKVKKSCFCCCDNEVEQLPEYEVTTNQKQNATRIITVTIEHLRHSLVDTPSHVRVLSEDKKQAFYQKELGVYVDTFKFYYLHNEIFDEAEYKMHLQDSETFARIVMQLKAMINHYPDEAQLQKIIQQHYSHYFGQKLTEEIRTMEVKDGAT